jgi:hypothetical protein
MNQNPGLIEWDADRDIIYTDAEKAQICRGDLLGEIEALAIFSSGKRRLP